MLDQIGRAQTATALRQMADRLDALEAAWEDLRVILRPEIVMVDADVEATSNRLRASLLRYLASEIAPAGLHHDPACAFGDAMRATLTDPADQEER